MKHIKRFYEGFQKNPKVAKNHGYEIIDGMSLSDAMQMFGTEARRGKKKDRKYCLVTLAKEYGTKCVNCDTFGTRFMLSRARNGVLHWDMYSDDETMITLDHIVPKSKGGGDNIENLQLMCMVCNGTKGNKHMHTLLEKKQVSDVDVNKLISIAKEVCDDYPQEWGDCYKVNSTVAYWINKKLDEWRMRIYQIRAELDREIYDDEETGYTDEPYHVIVVDGYSESDDNQNFVPNSNSKCYDFSNVFVGDREAEVLDIVYDSELGGEVDEILYKLLDKKYN